MSAISSKKKSRESQPRVKRTVKESLPNFNQIKKAPDLATSISCEEIKFFNAENYEEKNFVKVEKIGEKSQYFFNRQLIGKFILFEHTVQSSSNFLHPSCIEIVAYASYIVQQGIDENKKIEASRLYLCGKKIFELAVEEQKGNSFRIGSRPLGSSYSQILMINYIIPRIIISKVVANSNDLLQIEWYIYRYMYT